MHTTAAQVSHSGESLRLRVMLVDEQPAFREGMKAVLERQIDIVVVGEASNAREAYAIAEANRPDVVVLDVSLPGIDGIAATRELRRRAPNSKVLILSAHGPELCAAQALAAGAQGYAVKTQECDAIVDAIREVGHDKRYLPPAFSLSTAPGNHSGDDSLPQLTLREREVFGLLVRGFTNAKAGVELCISRKTVETHRGHILKKLGLHSIGSLIRFAAVRGLLIDVLPFVGPVDASPV